MHRLFAPVVAPLIEALEPHSILETGAGAGRLTRKVLEAPGAGSAPVHAVDPAPSLDPDLAEEHGERLVIHAQRAISAIGRIGAVDLALLDGDPNWYSVHTELRMLIEAAERARRPAPVVVVHNLHWPFGRRDGYHDPAAIPAAHRHEHSALGLIPGRRDPCPDGLKLTPYCAVSDFEPRSGVLSAVEDLIAESDLEWAMTEVPGFHGCGVLVDARRRAERPEVSRVLEGLRASRFLRSQVRRAEAARLEVEVELATSHPPELPPERPQPAPQAQPERTSEPIREALEWRLKRLEEDLLSRDERLEVLTGERDDERRGLIEVRVRLEEATTQLSAERTEASELKERIAQLQQSSVARERELHDVTERERLAQGRLSHREDALQASNAEIEKLRAEVEGLREQVRAGGELLDEVAARIDEAAETRSVRFGRRLRRIARALSLRRSPPPPDPYELAMSAAQRGLPALSRPPAADDPDGEVREGLEADLRQP
ncbi:MAG: hypothetical protein WDZ46_04275 [Solirubrobacterales bacterium]